MNTKLKFGIIGCSRISQRSVIPAIMQSQNAELEIIGSRTLTKAKEFSNEFNCKKFGSYDDVISDESIDVVYISTPIGTHEEWVVKAASAGKHVLCEKSSTISFESAKRMLDVCNKNNVEILEGFMFRFHPQHKKIKSLISNNSIGDLISFQGNFGFPSFPENDIRYKKELGGGFLNDSGCYPICASRMIFDEEPLGVSCKLYIDDKFGVDTRGTSILIYTNNKSASITFGNGNFYQANYTVWGTDGILSLDRAYSVPSDFRASVNLKYNTEKNWSSRKNKQYEIDPTNHFLEMIDAFCLELSQKSNCPFNFKKDFQNQAKVMEAHRISSSENRYVALDEIM